MLVHWPRALSLERRRIKLLKQRTKESVYPSMIDRMSLLFYLTNVGLVADWGDDPLMPLDSFKVDIELVSLTQTVVLFCSVLVAILVA